MSGHRARRCYVKVLSHIVFATIISVSQVRAEDIDKLSVIDFLLDWKQYIGKRVTVTDCALLRTRGVARLLLSQRNFFECCPNTGRYSA